MSQKAFDLYGWHALKGRVFKIGFKNWLKY